jgi:hypothetical protein
VPVADQEVPVADQEVPVADQEVPVADQEVPVADQEVPVADQEVPVADQEVPVELLSLKSSKRRCQATTRTGMVLSHPTKLRLSIVDSKVWLALLMPIQMAVSQRQSLRKQ